MKRVLAITVLGAVLALGGCFKKVTTDTTAVIKTMLQETDKDPLIPLAGVEAYAWYTNSTDWQVTGYADAVARRIVKADGTEERTEPDAVGEPYDEYGSGDYTAVPLKGKTALIVVVDPRTKMYATMYRSLEAENLPQTYLALTFHAWKSDPYKEGNKEGFTWEVFPPAEPYVPTPSEPENPDGGDGGAADGEGGGEQTPTEPTTPTEPAPEE